MKATRLITACLLLCFGVSAVAAGGGWPSPRQEIGTSCDGTNCTVNGGATPIATRSCVSATNGGATDAEWAFTTAADTDSATTGVISNTAGGWTQVMQDHTTTFNVNLVYALWRRVRDALADTSTWTYEDGNGGDDTALFRCSVMPYTNTLTSAPLSVAWAAGHQALELNGGAGPGVAWAGAGCPTITSGRVGDLHAMVQYMSNNGESAAAPTGWNLNIDDRSTSRGHIWASRKLYAVQSVDPGPWLHVGQAIGTDAICVAWFVRSAGIPTQYRRIRS